MRLPIIRISCITFFSVLVAISFKSKTHIWTGLKAFFCRKRHSMKKPMYG